MPTIDSVEVVRVRVPLDQVYSGSYYRMRNRCTIITTVRTSDGVVGRAYNADTDEEQDHVAHLVTEELAPRIVGLDVQQIELVWQRMLPLTYDQLAHRWLSMQAIACVDTAVWDAVGQLVGEPLWRLWGGTRDSIPVIGIGGYYTNDPAVLENEIDFFAKQHGLGGMKFKIGGRSPEEDAARLRLAQSHAPEGFVFVVDANQGYTVDEAVRFAELVRDDVELRWFEEPTRWYGDNEALRDVRLRANVRVAAGQSEISSVGMRRMICNGAIDVCNFDASWSGGPTEWRRVAALAQVFGVELGHHEEAHLASHLLASVPGGTFAEVFSPSRDPIFWGMLANRPAFEGGRLPLSAAPGLGWELDEDFIDKYRVCD